MIKHMAVAGLLLFLCSPIRGEDTRQQAQNSLNIDSIRNLKEQFQDMVVLLDGDEPETVRSAAAIRLSRSKREAEVFWKLLDDRNAVVREYAVQAVGATAYLAKERECPIQIVHALLDESEAVRLMAGTYMPIFERLPDEAQPVLLKALRHEDGRVRSAAAQGFPLLGKGAKQNVPELKRMLEDGDALVRQNAAVALWNITGCAALVMRTSLRTLATAPPTETVETMSREALARLGSAVFLDRISTEAPHEVAAALLECLDDASAEVRSAAARCLGAMALNGPKARSSLHDLKAQEALTRLLDDPDAGVRREAEAAAGKIEELGRIKKHLGAGRE